METAVIFDLDGTLLNTLEDLHSAVNYALTQFGYPQRTLEEVRRFVGNGAERLLRLAVPEGADHTPVLAVFRTYYQSHSREKTAPYPGIPAALTKLAGKYPLAIVSNKPDAAVKSLCAALFPGVYALGERGDCPRKPAADMVYKAMEALGVERCVYVGDSEVDVQTAKNADVPCVSVLWGFRTRQELEQAGASCFCENTEELLETLDSLMSA